jgi:hypothetical protein
LSNQNIDSNKAAIAARLGLDSAYGYHIESGVHGVDAFYRRHAHRHSRFPCIADNRSYRNCREHYCKARRCWAKRLVESAPHRTLSRPSVQRKGSRCHTCRNIAPDHHVSGKRGVELLTCRAGHFSCPVTSSCLVNRRVPETVSIPCQDYRETARAVVVKRHGRGGDEDSQP